MTESHWCVSEHMASATTALAVALCRTIRKHAIRSPEVNHVFCFRTLTGWSALVNAHLSYQLRRYNGRQNSTGVDTWVYVGRYPKETGPR
jgi:hypothetical protein